MKLLFVNRNLDGSEIRLIEELLLRGFRVEVMCSEHCETLDRLQALSVPVEFCNFRRKLDWPAIRQVRDKVMSGCFDLIQASTSRALSGVLLATTGLVSAPKVVGFRGIMDRVSRWDPVSWMTYLHPRLSGIACISESARDALRASGVPDSKLQTTFLGFDLPSPDGVDRSGIRALGIPDEAMVIGFAGNIRPVKGVDLLLKALRNLAQRPDWHLVLMGRMLDSSVAKELTSPEFSGRVHALGFRKDVDCLLRGIDILVMPSRQEGFGRSIAEAMRRGVCSIVTNVGGLPELIRHEQDGLVIPPDDVPALTEAINRLLNDPSLRTRLGHSARLRVQDHFSVEQMTDRYCVLYERVLNQFSRAAG